MAHTDFVINGTVLEKYTGHNNRLVIPPGITKIASKAFAGNSALISVSVPKGVTTIGDEAFMNCDSLAVVDLPEGVIRIDARVFYGCTRLRTISLPQSVKTIGRYAFKYCKELANYKGFVVVCGLLCDYVGKDADITIPAGVRAIAEGAFMNNNILRKVNFSEGVLKIGQKAFHGCTNLRTVALPQSLQVIGEQAFESCSSLLTINIPKNVKSVGDWAFSGCDQLHTVAIEPGATIDGSYIFDTSEQLADKNGFVIIDNVLHTYFGTDVQVTIPDGVTTINKNAFEDSAIEEVTIPESVLLIDNYAFLRCNNLHKVNLPDNLPQIADGAFVRCDILVNTGPFFILNNVLYTYNGTQAKVVIPKGVTAIAPWAFAGHAVEEVVIPDGVTTIGEEAFQGCGQLCSVTIPASVTTIGSMAFSNCPCLEDNGGCVILQDVFYNYYGYDSKLVIPSHITKIEAEAFAEAENIEEIYFPKAITEIEPGMFQECKKLRVIFFENKDVSLRGEIFAPNFKTQIWAPPGGKLEAIAKKKGLSFYLQDGVNKPLRYRRTACLQ